jgi:hypothetical protein
MLLYGCGGCNQLYQNFVPKYNQCSPPLIHITSWTAKTKSGRGRPATIQPRGGEAFQSAWIRHQKQLYFNKPSSSSSSSSSCAHFVFCHGPTKCELLRLGSIQPCVRQNLKLFVKISSNATLQGLQEVYTSFVVSLLMLLLPLCLIPGVDAWHSTTTLWTFVVFTLVSFCLRIHKEE